ncbi:uncharacterized protein [Panulirus ornatus]
MTRTERRRELLVSWVMRKYVKFLVLGALSSCALLNLALHAGAGLQYYCQDECLAGVLKGPVKTLDKDVVLYIRDHWVDAPAPRGMYKATFPLDNPPWATVGYWGEGYHFINNYFKQYKNPGTFMEIGAKDGEFMSLTLFLEQKLGFSGLLVEPNPRDYQKLRAAGRSSYSINACATPGGSHRKDVLWMQDPPENLPEVVRHVQEGNSILLQYVQQEERSLGRTLEVQCFNAGAMALAALKTVKVDLLVISTHAGHLDILTSIHLGIKFRWTMFFCQMVVVLVSLVASEDWKTFMSIARSRGLTPVFNKYNFHILIPEAEAEHV